MKTDIREKDDQYELAVDLPGFKKDEINLDVKDGYLTISAQKGLDKDEENKKGRILRQERYAESVNYSIVIVLQEEHFLASSFGRAIVRTPDSYFAFTSSGFTSPT